MDKKPLPDLTTLFPLGLGALSLFGILLVLLIGRINARSATVLEPATPTPFTYVLIGTEPGISTRAVETIDPNTSEPGSPDSFTTPIPGFAVTAQQGIQGTPVSSSNSTSSSSAVQTAANNTSGAPIVTFGTQPRTPTPGFIAASRTPTLTFTPRFTPSITPSRTPSSLQTATNVPGQVTSTPTRTPTRTPTSASGPPLNPGTYDDTDAHFIYSGNWTSETNVVGAFQGTLHVSSTLNNTIRFSFIGQELRLFYQSGTSLGTIRISIDGSQFDLDQSADSTQNSEWVSATLVNGTHSVVITHLEGGSVNLDSVIIPE